jgi:hypothetical protein
MITGPANARRNRTIKAEALQVKRFYERVDYPNRLSSATYFSSRCGKSVA